MAVRTTEMPFLVSTILSEPLKNTEELLKVIRADTQQMSDAEMAGPLFEQHGANAVSVYETFQSARGPNAARVAVNGLIYYILALTVDAPRRAVPGLTWRLMFAPAVGGRCPVTGASFLAEALKIVVADRAIFNRGRELRVMSQGSVEIEFDGAAESDPPVVSTFQPTGGKGFAPETQAIKSWRSIAVHRLRPLLDAITAAE